MTFRFGRFFFQTDGLALGIELNHAVTLRVAHLVTKNARARFNRERLTIKVQLPVENVVPKNEGRARLAEELCADQKSLRDSFRFRLCGVFDAKAELRAVVQKITEHRQIFRRRDDQDFAQATEHEGGERITDHGLVVNGQKLFTDDLGDRKKARAGAAREENGLFIHK